MKESLALKYRPRRYTEVAGQHAVSRILYHMTLREAIPGALLFSGGSGSGKTSTARILGAALNCLKWREDKAKAIAAGVLRYPDIPCGQCDSCTAIAEGTSPDVIEVDAASSGGVDEIRKLRDLTRYETGGLYRVVLLDEAHSMSRDAFNALLKVMEEPPENTVFVLLTTEDTKILPTVAGRCMPFDFHPINQRDIVARLAWICEQEGQQVDPQLLGILAERANGGLRIAVNLLDQALRVEIRTAPQFAVLHGDTDFAPALLRAMAAGDRAAMFAHAEEVLQDSGDYAAFVVRLVGCLKDLMTLKGGGTISARGPALEARRELAERIDAVRLGAVVTVLWDLRTKVRVPEPRTSLDLALAMCAEKLCPATAAPAPLAHANGNGHGNGHATAAALRASAAWQ